MSRRALIAVSAGTALAGIAISVGIYVVLSDDPLPQGTGAFIAYSCKERKNNWYAVCVMKVDGSEKRRLTDRLTTTDPAWSPDGRQIAFTHNEDVGEATTFTDDDVFVMDADGGNIRQLTPEAVGSSSNQAAWSPDGRRIVYVRGPSIHSAVVATTPLAFGELLVVDADGGGSSRLTRAEPDAAPAWSPDGREVVFVRGHNLNEPTGDMDLFIVDAAGGTPRALTRTPRWLETAPVWSPDGSRIAFARSCRSLRSPVRQRSSSSTAMDPTNRSCLSTSSIPRRPTGSAGVRTGGPSRSRRENWIAPSLRQLRLRPDTYVA